MAVGDHIRATIDQLEMQNKLPTDRRNFDNSNEVNVLSIQRLSDSGSLPHGSENQHNLDIASKSYRRPTNRKNNQMIAHYDLDDSGSANGGFFPTGCQTFRKNVRSKCNFTIVAILLSILCIVQFIILIILAVRISSGGTSGAQDLRRASSTGKGSVTKVLGGRAEPGQVVFYDDFDEFDESVWRHDRYLTTDGFVIYGSNVNNSYVDDGILFIEPTFTADHFNESFLSFGRLTVGRTIEKSCSSFYQSQCEKSADRKTYKILNPIMSASVRTSQSFAFQYGVLELRAKMPAGDWISTEISLMPRFEYYGEPADTAKMVLITTRGNMDYYGSNQTHFGQERFCSQLIYSDSKSTARSSSMVQHCHNSAPGDGFGLDFHTYKFEWSPDMLKVFVDDRLVGRFIANTVVPANVRHVVVAADQEENLEGSSFNQEFYINIKVGVGVGFPDTGVSALSRRAGAKPWRNDEPERAYRFWNSRRAWESSWGNGSSCLQIDYIKVHAL